MMTNVIPLAQATDPSRFGPKAAALARLLRAGLPAPDGFALPADLAEEQIEAAIPHLAAALAHRAPYGLIARSSATCEDGTQASFAGLYTSSFCPTDPTALQHAVRGVRASAGSELARAYATARNIDRTSRMAVIVQPALRPHAGGVLGIERGHHRRWRIEAIRGLAEPLANGAQTGEIHCSDGQSVPGRQTEITLPGTPHELQLMPGEWIALPLPGGGAERAKIRSSAAGLLHLYSPGPRPVLDDAQQTRLLDLAVAAAHCLSLDSVDAEWALLPDDTVHLVQMRPLTAPLPASPTTDQQDPERGWQGIPASPGKISGPLVRISELPPGTIKGHVLVCGNIGADAAAALLQEPAAIITTCGGPLSHAAITARELGIPCVTALPEAINRLSAGTNVSVNGSTGTVLPAPPPSARLTRPPRPQQRPPASTDRTAIVVLHPGLEAPDYAVATLVLHQPDETLNTPIPSRPTSPPTGLFQPSEKPPLSPLPAGYTDYHLPGIGRLAWPDDAGPLPEQLTVLNGSQVIHQRPTAVTAASAAAQGAKTDGTADGPVLQEPREQTGICSPPRPPEGPSTVKDAEGAQADTGWSALGTAGSNATGSTLGEHLR